ncbi:polysaccharide pyruvyl transferase family protein [Agromyces sp. M3QZ16-3]|uniref:polysaccharide pyruvyl transferase family protein n=1 Tax=Agromyces sp. M3QZ16-3 TaxID=3447585 RepID=UPI003F690945
MSGHTVGIATIDDDGNFGNRLQNYALQCALRELGWQPETIRNRSGPWPRSTLLPRLLHQLASEPRSLARRVRQRLIPETDLGPPFAGVRRDAIADFARSLTARSVEAFDHSAPGGWADRYDKVVAGSDQVWNPAYRRAGGFDFLTFAPPAKRIAYAASFGTPTIPRYLRSRYAEWIAAIPHVSVREPRGSELIEELTGRTVPVVVDPTVLVDRSVWDDLIIDAEVPSEPYGVQFLLGRPESQEWLSSQRVDVPLIDLNDLSMAASARLDPRGFVAAIAHAEVVVTDSFHAAVFAMRYRRPLLARRRHATDDRVQSLLALHGVPSSADRSGGIGFDARFDWAQAEVSVERARVDSTAFLSGALNETPQ